ncbi:MAG: S8 family serine peptidase [Bacteroidota bacterium]
MNYLKLLALPLLCLFLTTKTTAQDNPFVPGHLLVDARKGVELAAWLAAWNARQPAEWQIEKGELVSRPVNIWLLHFEEDQTDSWALRKRVQEHPDIEVAQFNHYVQLRGEPNDLNFGAQWQYQNTGQSGGNNDADIDAVEAWDLTTGGLTATGDTIVVAVLDNGVDLNHPDLQRNLWVNHAEIPDNGIDDDNNGYVDDYFGWNVLDSSDNVQGGNHGTSVVGIIGADGDNELGVAGVNWYVKVMVIRNNFNTTEDKILSAYSYALEARQRYDATGGAEGAFVVATNASWGVDEGQPEDAPVWCNFYDILGAAGIINCGATANENFNVEETGDLPTTCPSDYLISVTNTNHFDEKEINAGFGNLSIDLGAPGEGAYTVALNGNYGSFAGTSGATPHVTGVAALLYSLDCPALMALVQSDPGAAALLIKEAILEGVDPIPALAGITVTGGRLNAFNSLNYLLTRCSGCLPASSVQVTNLTDTDANINWVTNDSLLSVDIRWRRVGAVDWNTTTNATSPLLLTGLQACTNYEFQLQSNCANDVIPFGNSRIFTTDGCCDPPSDIKAEAITNESLDLTWDDVLAATSYQVRYRVSGGAWAILGSNTTLLTLTGLTTCTLYEYQVRTICPGTTSDWSAIQTVLTSGCGACLGEAYCDPSGELDADAEYIERIEIGGFFDNFSGGSSAGYQDFGLTLDPVELQAGESYPLQFTPAYPSLDTFPQAWKVWIDWDQNGFFTTQELLVDLEALIGPRNSTLTVPSNALLGSTRMRVLMQFNIAGGACPFTDGFGEIEDYCVEILPATCPQPDYLALDATTFNSAEFSWGIVDDATGYEADYRASGTLDWLPAQVTDNRASITGLDSCGLYDFRVRTVCETSTAVGYLATTFETCTVGIDELTQRQSQWEAYPVPTADQLFLRWQNVNEAPDFQLELRDALGRVVTTDTWIGQVVQSVDMQRFPSGLYQLLLYREGQLWSQRRVVKQ